MDPMGLTWLFFLWKKQSQIRRIQLIYLRKGLWALQGTLMYPHPFEIRVEQRLLNHRYPQKKQAGTKNLSCHQKKTVDQWVTFVPVETPVEQ